MATPTTYYSYCTTGILSIGCKLFTDAGRTTAVANGFYSDGSNSYTVSGGVGEITSIFICPATTTTTAAPTTTTTTSLPPDTFINNYSEDSIISAVYAGAGGTTNFVSTILTGSFPLSANTSVTGYRVLSNYSGFVNVVISQLNDLGSAYIYIRKNGVGVDTIYINTPGSYSSYINLSSGDIVDISLLIQ